MNDYPFCMSCGAYTLDEHQLCERCARLPEMGPTRRCSCAREPFTDRIVRVVDTCPVHGHD